MKQFKKQQCKKYINVDQKEVIKNGVLYIIFYWMIIFQMFINCKQEIFIKSQLITQMNDKQGTSRDDVNLYSKMEKIDNYIKDQKNYLHFQKNYPKNIFIPIIEYLAGLGFKQDYQHCVGTREEFEGKNVVSLSLIYQLLSQEWFQRNVNKRLLEANISNKILMNSKIKKKLFHLKVIKILLNSQAQDAKIYKKIVSRAANKIALNIEEDDQLFQYPSSIIYLLKLFLTTLKIFFKQNLQFQLYQNDQDQLSNMNRQINSKEQVKSLIKTIIQLFNHVKCTKETLEIIQQKIKQMIQYRACQINKKYSLNQNIPFWKDFSTSVLEKCFHSKMESQKITITTFNQWLIDFKNKSNNLGLNNIHQLQQQPYLKLLMPTILIHPPPE